MHIFLNNLITETANPHPSVGEDLSPPLGGGADVWP